MTSRNHRRNEVKPERCDECCSFCVLFIITSLTKITLQGFTKQYLVLCETTLLMDDNVCTICMSSYRHNKTL